MIHDGDLETTREAITQRGLFIHRYSGIEHAVAELIMRAQSDSIYVGLGDMPFKFASKIERVRTILELEGPVKVYDQSIRKMLREFLKVEGFRHFLTHGLMSIPRDATDRTQLCFTMYDHIEGKPHYGELKITLEKLKQVAKEMQPLSTGFTALVARICRECNFEELSVLAAVTRTMKGPKL